MVCGGAVLAVDDSPTQGPELRADLEDAGFEVTLAASGEEALEHLDARSFDVVVSQVIMPRIDGYELCARAKQRNPDLPVVLLTALTDPTEIIRSLGAGADNVLRKPYDPAQLVSGLQAILGQRKMRLSGEVEMGVEVMLNGQRFVITAERRQILDLLVSSFENLVAMNERLRQHEEELALANEKLEKQLAALEDEHQRRAAVLGALPNGVAARPSVGAVHPVPSAATAASRGSSTGQSTEAAVPSVDARADHELRQEAELRAAIASGQLEVHYQPQVALDSGAALGFEALARWRHPEHGLMAAADFGPLTEETGLINPLGWWVLEEACRQAGEWRARLPGAEHAVVSVNLAASQLAEDDVTSRVEKILLDTGLDPSGLALEMTESGVMAAAPAVAERLNRLKSLGVGLTINYLGTGLSSLLQLRSYPVDALKIDRAFAAGMTDDAADAAIVVGAVRLAQALGIDTVAEGVETLDQVVQLRAALGCKRAQGDYWSPALAGDQLEQWWEKHELLAAVLQRR